jgi:hypothetical protein
MKDKRGKKGDLCLSTHTCRDRAAAMCAGVGLFLFNLAYKTRRRQKEKFKLTIKTRTEGDRHGEFDLDSSDRAHCDLGGSAGHEGTNLMAECSVT